MSEQLADTSSSAATGVGPQLRAAREAKGLTTAQIAAQTRISVSAVEAIESGAFERLPGRIYAIGFSKTYAKLVGLDQTDVADMVRFEMGEEAQNRAVTADFTPGDPARSPSRLLVWLSVAALVLLVAGMWFAARVPMDPAAELPSLVEEERERQAAAAAAAAAREPAAGAAVQASGPVVLTAEDRVWLRVSDANGQRLMEAELAAGQSYTVPATANRPTLMTGRPDALAITIGGRAVPKIAEEMRTVSNVAIDATSLAARASPASPAASASRAASASVANGSVAGATSAVD